MTEISKTQKFDLSKIRVPLRENELSVRLHNLMPGEGFVVDGRERSEILTGARDLHKMGWKFTTKKLGTLKYQVVRTK